MKNTLKNPLFKFLLICAVIFACYKLLALTFVWSFCGVRELSGMETDIFFTLCPQDAQQRYEEHLFWEECINQDKQVPPNTEIIISACTDPEVRGVPGGELLYVYENKTGDVYLLDLRTGEKRLLPSDFGGTFLTSELVWIHGSAVGPNNINYRPHYVLDLIDGQKYELIDFDWEAVTGYLDNGELNPIFIKYLTEAEQIFIHPTRNRLIILAPNFRQKNGESIIISLSDFSLMSSEISDTEVVINLLRNLQVDYKIIDFSLKYAGMPSPTGKYIARNDGIYYAGTDTPLLLEYLGASAYDMNSFNGWYYDERSIVFTLGKYSYKIISIPGLVEYIYFPRPVLKLNLPVP